MRRRVLRLHVITAQEAGFGNSTDLAILAFAAAEGCIVVPHDVRTMTAYAVTRLQAKQPMAGLILIPQAYPVGHAIEDLLLIAEVTTAEDWQGKMVFLPLIKALSHSPGQRVLLQSDGFNISITYKVSHV